MKHIQTLETRNLCESAKNGGCGEFLPVCLQDELRHCKPAVREHGEEREVIQRFRKRRLFWRLFSCIDAKGFFR